MKIALVVLLLSSVAAASESEAPLKRKIAKLSKEIAEIEKVKAKIDAMVAVKVSAKREEKVESGVKQVKYRLPVTAQNKTKLLLSRVMIWVFEKDWDRHSRLGLPHFIQKLKPLAATTKTAERHPKAELKAAPFFLVNSVKYVDKKGFAAQHEFNWVSYMRARDELAKAEAELKKLKGDAEPGDF